MRFSIWSLVILFGSSSALCADGGLPDSVLMFSLQNDKPTKEAISRFVVPSKTGVAYASQVVWLGGLDEVVTFFDDGTANIFKVDPGCGCEEPPQYLFTDGSLKVACRGLCKALSPLRLEVKVLAANEHGLLLLRQGSMAVLHACSEARDHAVWCQWSQQEFRATDRGFLMTSIVIQLIPGNKDMGMFRRLEAAIQEMARLWVRWGHENDYPALVARGWEYGTTTALVVGLPASRPRTMTEVYYVVNEATEPEEVLRSTAEFVARNLEPLAGRVDVKKWPGKWPAQIVVVAGAEVSDGGVSQ